MLTFKRLLLFYWTILISVVRVIEGVPSLEREIRENILEDRAEIAALMRRFSRCLAKAVFDDNSEEALKLAALQTLSIVSYNFSDY